MSTILSSDDIKSIELEVQSFRDTLIIKKKEELENKLMKRLEENWTNKLRPILKAEIVHEFENDIKSLKQQLIDKEQQLELCKIEYEQRLIKKDNKLNLYKKLCSEYKDTILEKTNKLKEYTLQLHEYEEEFITKIKEYESELEKCKLEYESELEKCKYKCYS